MWPNGLLKVISRGSRLEPYIYLSFDDGPDPVYTPRLLDILAVCGVQANFFVVGAECQRHPALLERIVNEGHTVGNHSFSHLHPWRISAARAREEVRQGFTAIAGICNRPPRFFRPPYGRLRKVMLDEAHALHSRTILWSRSAMYWGVFGTPAAVARRLADTQPGDILLLHDAVRLKNRPSATLRLLPGFIGACREKGLHFAGLGRLLPENQACLTSTAATIESVPDPSNLAGNGNALIKETSTAAR
jgi:peptidoglycan/xylan/chitin deacetylase (PgdA/CDA1 family)